MKQEVQAQQATQNSNEKVKKSSPRVHHEEQCHNVEEMLEHVGIKHPQYASHLPGYVKHHVTHDNAE